MCIKYTFCIDDTHFLCIIKIYTDLAARRKALMTKIKKNKGRVKQYEKEGLVKEVGRCRFRF